MDAFNKQFCKPTDMAMYFSVFLGQKHAAYCEFYLSLCTYGYMIQYAVQSFCFSRDFYRHNTLSCLTLASYPQSAGAWRVLKILFANIMFQIIKFVTLVVAPAVEKWLMFLKLTWRCVRGLWDFFTTWVVIFAVWSFHLHTAFVYLLWVELKYQIFLIELNVVSSLTKKRHKGQCSFVRYKDKY